VPCIDCLLQLGKVGVESFFIRKRYEFRNDGIVQGTEIELIVCFKTIRNQRRKRPISWQWRSLLMDGSNGRLGSFVEASHIGERM
jgi:hypothetical protein